MNLHTIARVSSLLILLGLLPVPAWPAPYQGIDEILAQSPASDWHTPAEEDLVYMDLPAGRVVIELAPAFAPRHVANVRALIREKYFDGLSINRAQDNYVVQWGDPDEVHPRSVGSANAHLPAEFTRSSKALPFTRLPDPDTYAPEVGFAGDFPAARDPKTGLAWLAHCYGMVGAGRDNDADSGGGTELYAVIGHAPRHLDRNVTLLGRVLQGMPLLSTMPRGTGALGFYEQASQRVPIKTVGLWRDLPPEQRHPLEVLRTDSATFARVIESRRNRRDEWTKSPAGHIELCNAPLQVRVRP